jgi:TonB family protein
MKRIAVVWLVFAIGTCVARGQPAPRLRQVPEELRVVRDERGNVQAKALYAPLPVYPYKARLQSWEGRGMYMLLLRPNGTVSGVAVLRSTGLKELDVAAARALIQWRFAPSKFSKVRIPINFRMLDRLRGETISDR